MKDFLKLVVFAGLFAIPSLTLYVENDYFFPFITGKNFWFRIIVDVVFAAWVILALYDAKYRPRFSWIAVTFGTFLVVMFFANLLGEHPRSSFWSNFERMDGYVSLVHTFLYMFVLGTMLTKKEHWQYLLGTSLVVACMVAFYGLAQYGGLIEGNNRIDSRLGNAAYMAVYMLFHIFILLWLFISSKNILLRIGYVVLALLFTFVLFETGTRGTALGLAVGILVMSAYVGVFGVKFREFRKIAIGGFVLLLVAIGGFVAARDSDFIQEQRNLKRIANISLDDLTTRATIWGMAWEGVQERPVLGWGQSNFNYVFNEKYEASLYAQEQWFDRAHNIFFDWLIAGGFLGLITYLGIFGACIYYLFWLPLRKDDERFTVLERGILLGLLAGYFTHNFVVFDNIVSYIFFAIILGLIHARVSKPIAAVERFKIDSTVVSQAALPVMLAAVGCVIYFVHMPGMAAAGDVIDALQVSEPMERLEQFEEALGRDSFAHQEITEQLAQQTMGVMRSQELPSETKAAYRNLTAEQLEKLAFEKPGDARIHVFIASYYRAIGDLERAESEMEIARSLSPEKPSIISQQGFIALAQNKNIEAKDLFETGFKLDENNIEAREYYAAALFYTGSSTEAEALLTDDPRVIDRFAKSDFLLNAANQAGANTFLATLFEYKTSKQPKDAQNWASLAFLQYQLGSTTQALATLTEAGEVIPSFAPTAQCIASNIEAGREPQEGCQ